MANHLTPTELAREAGLERREVISKCMEMGVPIFQGRIDKALFLTSMRSQSEPRHAGALSDQTIIRQLYQSYSNLDGFEQHVLDTSGLTAKETASLVVGEIESPRFTLK